MTRHGRRRRACSPPRPRPTTGTVTYTLRRPAAPGTYLYESGSDVAKQVEMGLEGALVVRPGVGADYAYDAATAVRPDAASSCCC